MLTHLRRPLVGIHASTATQECPALLTERYAWQTVLLSYAGADAFAVWIWMQPPDQDVCELE